MTPRSTEICNSFTKQAKNYECNAVAQKEIGKRLLARLDYIKIDPEFILDLGTGTGIFSKLLQEKYPKANIISLDFSLAMLQECREKGLRFLVQAAMEKLPFKDKSFDLIFSNQTIHWSFDLRALFIELNRISKTNGLFMFSTLGPDTFIELRKAWSLVDEFSHTNEWLDMHHVGDNLLASQWGDPVLDMEKIVLRYKSVDKLVSSLKAQGVHNINSRRRKSLTGKTTWQNFLIELNKLCVDGLCPLTYEVVYGHSWKNSKPKGLEEFSISVDSIKSKGRLHVSE